MYMCKYYWGIPRLGVARCLLGGTSWTTPPFLLTDPLLPLMLFLLFLSLDGFGSPWTEKEKEKKKSKQT